MALKIENNTLYNACVSHTLDRYISKNRGNMEMYEENGGIGILSGEIDGKWTVIRLVVINPQTGEYRIEKDEEYGKRIFRGNTLEDFYERGGIYGLCV